MLRTVFPTQLFFVKPLQSVAGSACTSPCCHCLCWKMKFRSLSLVKLGQSPHEEHMWPLAFGANGGSLRYALQSVHRNWLIYFFVNYLLSIYYLCIYIYDHLRIFLFEAIHLHTKGIKMHKHLPTLVFQNQFKPIQPILDSDFKTVFRRA